MNFLVSLFMGLLEAAGRLAAFFFAYKWGREKAEKEAAKNAVQDYKERQEVEDNIARIDAAEYKRLRDKWTRK